MAVLRAALVPVLLYVLFGVLLALWPGLGGAQSLESALSPGALIKGHAKWQDECARCHVRFDRAAQDGLCQDCHKSVAQDIRARTGFHGRQKPQACRSCHTDHKGRDASIVQLDTRAFDHTQTDYPLRLAHAKATCRSCHAAGKPWREAPQDCAACHRKDDVHKGSLGPKCADCHTESTWREAKFDHGTTRFALKGKHSDVKCADCHPNGRYRDVPQTCIGCHREDDKHKARYGERCDSCHTERSWKTVNFNHDAQTRYPLLGKHRSVRCDSCHTGQLYRDKLPQDCIACHRKDDKHKASLGSECQACHTESGWKETRRFDHDRSRFPLLGKHQDTDCKSCHKPGPGGAVAYREAPRACIACHRSDDKHERTLGEGCGSCHGERSWKIGRFDHDSARFALRGAHAGPKVQCSACHKDLRSYRSTPQDCNACHRKDDKHDGQLGPRCQSCHDDVRWKGARFDHNQSRFALLGAHAKVECKACHASARFKEAPQACVACHRQADVHKARLGEACQSCHNARHWKLVQFNHDRQTTFALTGAHLRVACATCHGAPAPAGRKIAPVATDCGGCHRRDDVHDGSFGNRCEQCHLTRDWKTLLPRHLGPATPTARPGGV